MSVFKALLTMVFGFAIFTFGIAAATAAKMADPNSWLNEVVAIGHVIALGGTGLICIAQGWDSLKSAWTGAASTNDKRRTSARRSKQNQNPKTA